MKHLFVVLFIIGLTPCIAQTRDSVAFTPKLSVRWSPFSLAGRFPNAQFGVEYRISRMNPAWTVSHDLGILVNGGEDTEGYANKRGFRAYTELRYYIMPSAKDLFYFSTELYHHRINYDRTELIGYDCESGDCSYFEYFSWKRKFTAQRGAIKVGVTFFFDPNKRLFSDLAAGIGYRIRRSEDFNKPPLPANAMSFGTDYVWPESAMIEDDETVTTTFSFRVGFRFK